MQTFQIVIYIRYRKLKIVITVIKSHVILAFSIKDLGLGLIRLRLEDYSYKIIHKPKFNTIIIQM
jgi:hypothetical protein